LAIYRSKYIRKDTIAVVDNLKKDQYSQQSISWLNSFHNPNIKHALNNGEVKICGLKVDGFDKKSNTVYQYHGCFWHGCTKCYSSDFINNKNIIIIITYKLYFDRTILTDIHIKHNRPDIIILNKQQKQAYLLDIAVPNSHNITQTYNTKINKYLELSVAMRNLWCLEKISILPLVISATGIVPQSLFKNLKILDLDNTLVVEIQKGILLYSCHIVRKFLNIDTEHNTQQSQNAEARRR
jgi:hypothetical protein